MSKGLEALNSLFETMPFAFLESNTMKELKIIEKELKALKILKEKLVDIQWLKDCEELADYNDLNTPTLEQEEYNLLKEVLNA